MVNDPDVSASTASSELGERFRKVAQVSEMTRTFEQVEKFCRQLIARWIPAGFVIVVSSLASMNGTASASVNSRLDHGMHAPVSWREHAYQRPASKSDGGRLPPPNQDQVVPRFGPRTSPIAARSWLNRAISVRESKLNLLLKSVSTAKNIPVSSRGSIERIVNNAKSALVELRPELNSKVTASQATGIAEKVAGYGVFSVITQQTKVTISAAHISLQATHLASDEGALDTVLASAGSGKGISLSDSVKLTYAKFVKSVYLATKNASAASSTALAISSKDDGAAQMKLALARADVTTAESNLHSARLYLKLLVGSLISKAK